MTTKCKAAEERMAELLLAPAEAPAELRAHVESCEACRAELESLRATMTLMDAWEAPEPNPFFMTRMEARLREERQARPQSWLERLRTRFVLSNGPQVRPLAAMAMTIMLLLGGGAYMSLTDQDRAAAPMGAQATIVNDLQSLDNNAQLLDQLEALSDAQDDNGEQYQ
jgi:anti-sigma factor RsiW